jgi:hypothetical protein
MPHISLRIAAVQGAVREVGAFTILGGTFDLEVDRVVRLNPFDEDSKTA